MYLLYLDDSGSASNPKEEYLVLAGISVFERQVHYLSEARDKLAVRFDPDDPGSVEFHASEIFRGKTAPWNSLKSRQERKQVLKDVLQVLVDGHHTNCAFACAVHKRSYPNHDPMELAFEELCNRFNHQLARLYETTQEPARGLIILDESAYETTLQGLARNFKTIGTRWGVTRNIVEVPLFVDSKASRCLQLADHVAYAVFRRYDQCDTSYVDPILCKFDSHEGRMHGLVHKQTFDRNCMCPACMSRRLTVREPADDDAT